MPTTDSVTKVSPRDMAAMALTLVGLVLIALSVVWPKVATGRRGWTDEKALAYQSASAELHRLSMQTAATEPENQTRALHENLADAELKYAELRAELDAARARPARIATILRYAGIAILAAGILGLVAKRGRTHAA